MEFTPVQSTMGAEIEHVIEEESKIEQMHTTMKAEMEARMAFATRYRTGRLNYKEYNALTKDQRRAYARLFGRPPTPADVRATSKKRTKAINARRAEKQARKQNR
jgi:hypothetical protein